MGEIVSSIILGVMSVITAVITTVGLSKPARIRHELRDVAPALSQLQLGTPAHKALSRVVEMRSAELVALQLVKLDSFLLGLCALLIIGGIGTVVVGRELPAAVAGGWIAVVLGYIVVYTHVPNVYRLRRRQARAILVGRPSGLVAIDASVPLRRSTVRQVVYRPEEYPLIPFVRRQIERSRKARNKASDDTRNEESSAQMGARVANPAPDGIPVE